jgi:hypothetical protein
MDADALTPFLGSFLVASLPARFPTPLEQGVPVASGQPKKCVLGGEKGFRGEDKAQHAQGRCRGVGVNMPKADTKSHFGLRAPRPHGLPKRALGLSFERKVPPDSGFTSKL